MDDLPPTLKQYLKLKFPNDFDDEDSNESAEEYCHYCGEPLEDGLCSSQCKESKEDEGRK